MDPEFPHAASQESTHPRLRISVKAYKNAWHLPRSTASALFIFPKTYAGKESTLPMAVLKQKLLLHAERCMRHHLMMRMCLKKSCWQS